MSASFVASEYSALFYVIRRTRIKRYLKGLSFTEVLCERINEREKCGMISVEDGETVM